MTRDGVRAATAADKKIGSRIRTRRRELDISQTSLGEQIGVSFRQVQKYESGLNRISITRLEQIAAALSMPIIELLTPQTLAQPRVARVTLAPAPLDAGTLEAFLRLPEARLLVEAFSAIPDQKTRQQILDLVGTVSRLGWLRDGTCSNAVE